MFVVYGSLFDLSNDSSQLTVILIYEHDKSKPYMKRYFGGGLCDINLAGSSIYTVVNTRFVISSQTSKQEKWDYVRH
jgi:hypothetical protein